jgi:hypothetical protein
MDGKVHLGIVGYGWTYVAKDEIVIHGPAEKMGRHLATFPSRIPTARRSHGLPGCGMQLRSGIRVLTATINHRRCLCTTSKK